MCELCDFDLFLLRKALTSGSGLIWALIFIIIIIIILIILRRVSIWSYLFLMLYDPNCLKTLLLPNPWNISVHKFILCGFKINFSTLRAVCDEQTVLNYGCSWSKLSTCFSLLWFINLLHFMCHLPASVWNTNRYLIFYCPLNLFYKCVAFLPVKLVLVALKEVVRVRKIAAGVHHAHHAYHHGFFIMVIVGYVKGWCFIFKYFQPSRLLITGASKRVRMCFCNWTRDEKQIYSVWKQPFKWVYYQLIDFLTERP